MIKAVTTKFIKDNFSIVDEALIIEYKEIVGTLDFDFFNDSPAKVLEQIQDTLKNFPEDFIINTENYGYDGGLDHIVYINRKRLETEQETIERLKKAERVKRREAKKIEEAKELLNINKIKG